MDNLIAEGNAGKIRKAFHELFFLRMLIDGKICFPLYQLLEPFITLWWGVGYILPEEILILLVIRLFSTNRLDLEIRSPATFCVFLMMITYGVVTALLMYCDMPDRAEWAPRAGGHWNLVDVDEEKLNVAMAVFARLSRNRGSALFIILRLSPSLDR